MNGVDATRDLQAFIDERWAVAQPRFYPSVQEAPRVPPEVTRAEAAYFLASVTGNGRQPPLFVVDDDRKLRSDRRPPKVDGSSRSFHFFEEPGRLRLETIVHMAATARLHYDFLWPREHLVFESPQIVDEDGNSVLGVSLDILLLEERCAHLAARMTTNATRARVGIEAKADKKLLDRLIQEMRGCQAVAHREHSKCRAMDVLRPNFFLGVAAAETWRLFTVVNHRGRAVLGDELSNLDGLHF